MAKTGKDFRKKAGFRAALWLAVAAMLGLGTPEGGQAAEDRAREKIVVEFALPGPAAQKSDAGVPEGPPEVAARILSRLGPEATESARVFERLPLLALDTDAETLLRLVRMPEVLAIRPDRNVVAIPLPGDIATPESPGGAQGPDGAAAPKDGERSKDDADMGRRDEQLGKDRDSAGS